MNEEPKPDALAPEAMREEFTNILFAKSGGKLSRNKCYEMVDAMLAKQMQFYAAVAEPEVVAAPHKVNDVLHEVQFTAGRLLEAGAEMSGYFGEGDEMRKKWQKRAVAFRQAVDHFLGLMA